MKYLQKLTDHLIEKLVDKSELNAWAEDGEIITGNQGGLDGFEVTYVSNFEMSDVNIEPITLFMLIASWLNKYDPDRDTKSLPNPHFFTERLDSGHYDLGVKIEFKEQYSFVDDDDGKFISQGVVGRFKSDYENVIDVDDLSQLEIVDSHKQDNKLQN